MACLEHECNKCNEVWFDNQHWSACPNCGSTDKRTLWDEEGSQYDKEYFYEEDEDETETE